MQDPQGSQDSTPAWEAAAISMTRAGMRRKVLLASCYELPLMIGALIVKGLGRENCLSVGHFSLP